MSQSKFNKLIRKYQFGKLNTKEEETMDSWFDSLATKEDSWSSSDVSKLKMKIAEQINTDQAVPKPVYVLSQKWRMIAAAVIFMMSSIGFYVYNDFRHQQATVNMMADNVAPGGNKARLKLANGREFSLRNDQDGIIIKANTFTYKDGSDLVSIERGQDEMNQEQTAILSTPRSGQYQITLSDGSKVWLNSDSKLTYPIAFREDKRIVKLEGEAYFEIKPLILRSSKNGLPNRQLPFLVMMDGQQVEVLGTEFNINGYPDEANLTTTLIEGSVKVSLSGKEALGAKKHSVILSPGEQSIIKNGHMRVNPIDVNEATAWKNGGFMFNDEGIESVMRKLARWYDVEVIYQGAMDDVRIWGSVSRSKHIAEVLSIIELTELVKFEVRGRRIYVIRK